MKTILIGFSLLLSFNLVAQPMLTLDYYFQKGKHEYNFYNVDNTILNQEGANLVWDFSSSQLGQHKNLTFFYQLDTLHGNAAYGLIPYHGTVSNDDLENANAMLTKSFAQGYLNFDVSFFRY